MQTNKFATYFSVDNLQKQVMENHRYAIVEEVMSVRNSLEKEERIVKKQKQKILQLRRKLLYLEEAQHQNHKKASQYRQRLQKMDTSQTMGLILLNLKANDFQQRSYDLAKKKQFCSALRLNLEQSRRKAAQIFQHRKTNRVNRIKKQNQQLQNQRKMRSQSDFQRRLNSKKQIKQQKDFARERLQRYEQFKLAQAKFNYDQKKRQLLKGHANKLNQLKDLQSKVSQQQQFFHRTQLLKKEAKQVQSLYLTGQ